MMPDVLALCSSDIVQAHSNLIDVLTDLQIAIERRNALPAVDTIDTHALTIMFAESARVHRARIDDPRVRVLSDGVNRGLCARLNQIASLANGIDVGAPVLAGDPVGIVGETGDASACHVHFGISFPCENDEWWVRRGLVWPWPYLDAWKSGLDVSPIDEVTAFMSDHPDVCQDKAALPWNTR